MDIRFISSLTAEDEEQFAPVLMKAVCTLLDQLPIAYTVRIETIGARTFAHSHAPDVSGVPERLANSRPASGLAAV